MVKMNGVTCFVLIFLNTILSNILPKDSSKVSYTQKLIVIKKFDNFAKITLRVTETGPPRII